MRPLTSLIIYVKVVQNEKIVIGSRGSKLAIIQANWVRSELEKLYPDIEFSIKKISTKGDKITDVSLARLGGTGLFTKEIENSLIEGEIDLAVHSAKDLPTVLSNSLVIGAVPKREDPHDVLLTRKGFLLDQLPEDAVIGTCSLRRKAQLLSKMSGLKIKDLRGNLDTRLKRLCDGDFDAIIVAHAGLIRMGCNEIEIKRQIISFDDMLPAVGQGALGIEIRKYDKKISLLIAPLNDDLTNKAITAERALLAKLQGGCQIPVGAIGISDFGGQLKLTAVVCSLNGSKIVRDSLEGPIEDAVGIGCELAQRLILKGADKILKEIRS